MFHDCFSIHHHASMVLYRSLQQRQAVQRPLSEHTNAGCAEVVLFTAGLEDYAKPIADELDRRYGDVFHHRLYRPATRTCSAYPCLKVLHLTSSLLTLHPCVC